MKYLLKNRKGQGTTEYVVILAIGVGLAVVVFGPMIKNILVPKIAHLGQQVQTAGN